MEGSWTTGIHVELGRSPSVLQHRRVTWVTTYDIFYGQLEDRNSKPPSTKYKEMEMLLTLI
jgi:hypothetical protein